MKASLFLIFFLWSLNRSQENGFFCDKCRDNSFPVLFCNETDPVGTQLLRVKINSSENVVLKLDEPDGTFFESAVKFVPSHGNNLKTCRFDANRANNGTSFCDLVLATSMDIEDLKNKTGKRLSFIKFIAECTPSRRRGPFCELFVKVLPVNEYAPEFTKEVYNVQFHIKQLERGRLLLDLRGKFSDRDVVATGINVEVAIGNHTDLVEINGGGRVLLKRDVTEDDVKDDTRLYVKLIAIDTEFVNRKRTDATLVVTVLGYERKDKTNASNNPGADTSHVNNSGGQTHNGTNSEPRSGRSSSSSSNRALFIGIPLGILLILAAISLVGFFVVAKRRTSKKDQGEYGAPSTGETGVVDQDLLSAAVSEVGQPTDEADEVHQDGSSSAGSDTDSMSDTS